ncbi:WXG100 family type VII secretion target [Plantactinospora sp. KBS50]|uniref:WXG100 family type VII secretion target n=1 Tax=Plantactinospora sp. KBS50 TaxID=2024580 RepID=UPI0012FD8605|nr:WXG100 family type VII secretion target [Plantactinospora sp. KBS50]
MEFKVTPETLVAAATNCRSVNSTIQNDIAAMRAYVAGLMSTYQGTAALALQALSDQWGRDATALNEVLNTIATGLDSNAGNYVESETTNTNNFQNLLGNLPRPGSDS